MNLSTLTDQQLHADTLKYVAQEREILTTVLHHLREIEKRRLFASYGCPSLFDYAVKHLGYSEPQAWRRVDAMRLLKEIPEIEEKIMSGRLTLTNIGVARAIFKAKSQRAEPVDREGKLLVLSQLENVSKRKAEEIACGIIGDEFSHKEIIRPISNDASEIRFIASKALLEKVEKLKGLLAHSHPGLSLADLIALLCEVGLSKWDSTARVTKNVDSVSPAKLNPHNNPHSPRGPNSSRYISARLRRSVWKAAGGKCENCKSTRALEVDHIVPFAKGGSTERANLRLLCRSCNQRAAIKNFGLRKMAKFIDT